MAGNGTIRVLVTGAGGTIGTVLLPRLAEVAEVTTLDVTPLATAEHSVRHVEGSIEDVDLLREFSQKTTHVIHLARDDPASWDALLNVDISGTRNVFAVAAESGVQRVIFASSTHPVGGLERDLLRGISEDIKEQHAFGELRPDSEYGVAKAFGEAYGRFVAEHTSLAVSCLRIGTMRPVDEPERYADEAGFSYIPGGREGVLRRLRATWLYHDDLWRIVQEELAASDKFRVRFGVSESPGRFWPLEVRCWNPAPAS